MELRKVETLEQIEETARLANEIWNGHYISIISQEQIDYMVQKFQSAEVIAEQIVEICRSIKKYFEYIIIDTGAGINSHVFNIVEQANLILVVTTPDPVCIRDASLMSDEFYNRGNKSQRLIINKIDKKIIGEALVNNLDEIIDKIGVQLIGVIPNDFKMTVATGKGHPIPTDSMALRAFDAISKRLLGEYIPLTVKTS